jgi:hypothetical protein
MCPCEKILETAIQEKAGMKWMNLYEMIT